MSAKQESSGEAGSRIADIKTSAKQSKTKTVSVIGQAGDSVSATVASMLNRKPCYRIHENGVEVRYFNFANPDKLPFDVNTYGNCQVFIGSWANPVYVDIQSFAEEYEEYDPDKHSLEGQHIIPSQRYKLYMAQGVLSDSFSTATMKTDMLLYAILGVGLLSFITLIVTIAGVAS